MENAFAGLEEKLAEAIESAPHVNRRMLRFENHSGRIILRGTVGSYFQKQMAQEAIRGVSGVKHIHNELEVDWSTPAVTAPVL